MVLSAGFDDQRQAPIAGGNEVGNPASRSASCRDRHFRHDLVCGSLGSERRRIENHFGHFEVGCDGRTGDVGWPGVRAAEPRQLDILPTDESGPADIAGTPIAAHFEVPEVVLYASSLGSE